MLTQQLTVRHEDNSGALTVTAAPGALAELIGLAEELNLRSNIETHGEIHQDWTPDTPPLG